VIRVLVALCLLASPALAVTRYALVLGNDAGDRDEQRLRFAEHDADRFAATLVGLGGFAPGDVAVVRGGDAESARTALIALNARIRQNGGTDAMLVVYYSGHADSEQLHLGTSNLPLTQLEQLVRGSPAAFRLLVVDACRSGNLTRVKGGTLGPAIPIQLGDTLAADGVVIWTASAASEQAQESDQIKGSFFTHFLVSGLAGPADEDGDGDVTTTEAYEYARAATLRASSRTLAGMQHPTFRDELAGREAIVLARPGTAGRTQGASTRAQLRIPEGRDVLVLAGNADGPVVAEVGLHDKTRRLNVRAGRYYIRERLDTHLLEGAVMLAAGDDRGIEDKDLARVEYVRVAAKGGVPRRRVDAIEASFLLRTPLAGGDPCTGAIAGYAFDLGWVTLTPRISACRERAGNAVLSSSTDTLAADARVAHAWRLGPVALTAQVQAGAAALHQQFDTSGVAPSRTTGAGFFGAGAGIGFAMSRGTYVSAAAELNSFVLERGDGMSSARASTLAFGALVGLGVEL
jgi:hypothetical protein